MREPMASYVTPNAPAEFDPIRHVVVLMLENRSFDQMLGAVSGMIPSLDGATGAARVNVDSTGHGYFQVPADAKRVDPDPMHERSDVKEQLEGDNTGFVRNYSKAYPSTTPTQRSKIISYFPLGMLP